MRSFPCLVRSMSPSGEPRDPLGDPFVGRCLEFVADRCRSSTLTATAFDLRTFFAVVVMCEAVWLRGRVLRQAVFRHVSPDGAESSRGLTEWSSVFDSVGPELYM